jgi:hypothetical protein
VDRSLRRDGLVLVMVGALLGVVVGVTLGLAVEPAGTGPAQAAAQPVRGAAVAAGAPSSEPPAARAPGSGTQADGGASADRPGGRHGDARKEGGNSRTKAESRGKDKDDEDKRKGKN